MRIDVSITDIAHQADMQAVVHAVNPFMRAGTGIGAGVAGPIHEAAGPQLKEFCDQHTPLAYGNAVLSPGFNLANNYIIHASIAPFHTEPDAELILANALESIMMIVNHQQIESLAIPAMATGTLACPPNHCASLFAQFFAYYKNEGTSLKHVRVCVQTQGIQRVFLQTLAGYQLNQEALT